MGYLWHIQRTLHRNTVDSVENEKLLCNGNSDQCALESGPLPWLHLNEADDTLTCYSVGRGGGVNFYIKNRFTHFPDYLTRTILTFLDRYFEKD